MGAIPAELPANEESRLQTLQRYGILDTAIEQPYQDIARLAAEVCACPIALVSLVDRDRQWFKAEIGQEVCQTSRSVSFCAHAILEPENLFIVPDASKDPRFAQNPLVLADPPIRFYAGAPLLTPNGMALGTLCVIDHVPRELTAAQQESLRALSRQVMVQLELHRQIREMEQTVAQRDRMQLTLRDSELRFRSAFDDAPIGMALVAPDGHWLKVNQALCDIVGYSQPELLALSFQDITHAADLEVDVGYVNQMLAGELRVYQMEKRYLHKDGHIVWIHLGVSLVRDDRGEPLYFVSQIRTSATVKWWKRRCARARSRPGSYSPTPTMHLFPLTKTASSRTGTCKLKQLSAGLGWKPWGSLCPT